MKIFSNINIINMDITLDGMKLTPSEEVSVLASITPGDYEHIDTLLIEAL